MSHENELGAILLSLSLHEDVDSDMMDVDESYDLPSPPEQTETQDTSPGLLKALVLLPTKLGAKYAIRHIHREPEAETDYEFDTTALPVVRARNVSSFSLGVASDFLHSPPAFDKAKSQAFSTASQTPSMASSQAFSMAPAQGPSFQVHHHHYYSPRTAQHLKLHEPDQQLHQVQVTPQQTQVAPQLPQPWEHSSPNERIPYMLTTYLQLVANALTFGYGAYILTTIVQAIRLDIGHRIATYTSNILVDIASCERQYVENNCQPDVVVPALEKQCNAWLKCMNQDPFNGGGHRLVVSAETIAMLVNLFVETLGWKFWLVVSMFTVVVFACNFLFGYLRAKTYYGVPSD